MTPWTAAHHASLSITSSQSLLKLMSIKSVMPPNPLILCHPLLLLPSIFLNIRVISNESVLCISWPSIEASALASVLLINIQGWFPLGLTGLISLQSKGLPRVFSNTTVQKHQFLELNNKRLSSLAFSMLRPSKSFCRKALFSFMNEIRLKYLKF